MNILVLQLKRIGDLVLTTPALATLREIYPSSLITLITEGATKTLLPAIGHVDEKLVYSRSESNADVWQCVRQGHWDLCLDFSGTDRSALMSWLCHAPRRIAFSWVRKRFLRSFAYTEFVDSSVRHAHTADHYLDLVRKLGPSDDPGKFHVPILQIPDAERANLGTLDLLKNVPEKFVLIHPGSARPEKYWPADRWAEVIIALKKAGWMSVITCGGDDFEKAHVAQIIEAERALLGEFIQTGSQNLPSDMLMEGPLVLHPDRLVQLAILVERARLMISADTAAVHMGAVFQTPQIALFGPTNPFHWRPRHDDSIVISAAFPSGPIHEFEPRMKGGKMAAIPVSTVLAAAEKLLAAGVKKTGLIVES